MTVAHLTDRPTTVDWSDAGSVLAELWSPLAGLVLAVVIRIGTGLAGLALAYPVVRSYRSRFEPPAVLANWIGRRLDGRGLTLAFRRLRWSHHVRREALARLGATGDRVGKLDRILDIANIGSFIVVVLVVVATLPACAMAPSRRCPTTSARGRTPSLRGGQG